MLIKEYLNKQNKQQKQLAEALNIDKRDINKIVNYKCLPLPEQAEKICEFLDCNILDIYNKKEIDLVKGTKKASRNNDSELYYRLSVRLNKAGCNCLKLENLQKLGYKTLKEWVLDCMEKLREQQKELARTTKTEQAQKDITK